MSRSDEPGRRHSGADDTPNGDAGDHPAAVPAHLQRAFADLGRLALGEPTDTFLQRVVDSALTHLPDLHGLSVTVVQDGTASTVASTSPLAVLLDRCQYRAGTGPCLEAAASGTTIVLDVPPPPSAVHTHKQPMYPQYEQVARLLGVRATVSVGMPPTCSAALNAFSRHGGIDARTTALTRTYAAYAAIALTSATALRARQGRGTDTPRTPQTHTPAERLRHVLATRLVVAEAVGALMGSRSVDARSAREHLEQLAASTGTSMHQTATTVLGSSDQLTTAHRIRPDESRKTADITPPRYGHRPGR